MRVNQPVLKVLVGMGLKVTVVAAALAPPQYPLVLGIPQHVHPVQAVALGKVLHQAKAVLVLVVPVAVMAVVAKAVLVLVVLAVMVAAAKVVLVPVVLAVMVAVAKVGLVQVALAAAMVAHVLVVPVALQAAMAAHVPVVLAALLVVMVVHVLVADPVWLVQVHPVAIVLAAWALMAIVPQAQTPVMTATPIRIVAVTKGLSSSHPAFVQPKCV